MPNLASSTEEQIFIGARDLKNEVIKIMPTFDLLKDQIEQIRTNAKQENLTLDDIRLDRHRSKDMNHTLGVFGVRGTGKTSVLHTIRNHLINENSNEDSRHNIVLPFIEPDQFGVNTKIMGSIIGLIKQAVEDQLVFIRGGGLFAFRYGESVSKG